MKKKFLGLAFVAIAITITSICLCGFGVKISDITDEEMNKVVFSGQVTQARGLVNSSVPYDTLTMAVNHTLPYGFPSIPSFGTYNGASVAAAANLMAYSSRVLPQLVADGSIYIGDGMYDSTGAAARGLYNRIYNRTGLAAGGDVTYEILKNAYGHESFDRNCYPLMISVATYGKYVKTEYLDRAMVQENYPLMIYVDAAEMVTGLSDYNSQLNFTSQILYGNQVFAGYAYKRYRIVKGGVISDEYLITVKNSDGRDMLLRLGGQTSIYRIYSEIFSA